MKRIDEIESAITQLIEDANKLHEAFALRGTWRRADNQYALAEVNNARERIDMATKMLQSSRI